MALKKFKLPKDLQLNDPFFVIEQAPMDDHKGLFAESRINHTSLAEEKVKRIEFDERDESVVVIKGQGKKVFTAPAMGKNGKFDVGDVIPDEDQAYDIAIDLAKVEYERAQQILREAEEVVKGVESNMDALKARSPEGPKANRGSSYAKVLRNTSNEGDETVREPND